MDASGNLSLPITRSPEPTLVDQDVVLQRGVNENTRLIPATTVDLETARMIFNILGSPLPLQINESTNNFEKIVPSELRDVRGDGNCLFNCFSLILTGSEIHASSIRNTICNKIVTLNYNPVHLVLPDGTNAVNVSTYIDMSNMRDSRAFGGPVEIATFCEVAAIDVLVYSSEAKEWIWFSADYNMSRPQIFLLHSQLHFQVVISLKTTDSLPNNQNHQQTCIQQKLKASTKRDSAEKEALQRNQGKDIRTQRERICTMHREIPLQQTTQDHNVNLQQVINKYLSPSEEDAEKSKKTMHVNDVTLQLLLKEHLLPLEGDEYNRDWANNSEPVCSKCLRSSTAEHFINVRYLNFQTVGLKRRQYGQSLKSMSHGHLCENCLKYVSTDTTDFSVAWPSILCTYWTSQTVSECVLKLIIRLLPVSVIDLYRQSWDHFTEMFKDIISQTKFIVADGTHRKKLLKEVIEKLEGKQIRDEINRQPVPDVICPWGCWEFAERCEEITFDHFLARFDPNYRNWCRKNDKLRGIVPLFPMGFTMLKKFKIRPHVRIDENNSLVVMTCSRHKGETLQYVHPPLNPILTNISPNKPERLALTQQKLHIVKTGKPKFNSHSSHLIEERGSFSGISSSTLHFPSLLDKSTDLQNLSEALTASGRSDVYNLVEYYRMNNIIDDNFVDFLYTSDLNLTKEEITHSLNHATSVSLFDAFKLQMTLNEAKSDQLETLPIPVYAHSSSQVSEYGPIPTRNFNSKDAAATVIEALAHFSSKFLEKLNLSADFNIKLLGKRLTSLLISTCHDASSKNKSLVRNSLLELLNLSSNENISASELRQLIEILGFPVVDLETRANIKIKTQTSMQNEGLIFFFPTKRCERSFEVPTDNFSFENEEYKLLLMSTNISEGEFFCRHACTHNAWFDSTKNNNTYSQVTYIDFYNETMKMRWEMAVYVKMDKLCNETIHRTFLKSIGGQSVFKCSQHKTWLIQRYITDNVHCYKTTCNLRVKWTCPISDCSAAVCQSHFLESENAETVEYIQSTHQQSNDLGEFEDFYSTELVELTQETNVVDDKRLFNSNHTLAFDPEDFLTSAIDNVDNYIPLVTNAGVTCTDYQLDSHCSDRKFPTKILLNNYLHVLKRSKVPIWTTNAHKHFLQSIVSKIPNTSVPLLYPEALLFPSIFWKQDEHGTSLGALPSFLLQSDKQNITAGFATVSDHLWSRLTNGSLLTSTNLNYASLAFDLKMNADMNNAHSTYVVFKRGYEDLLGDDDALKLPNTSMKWDGLNGSKRVQEVAAACAEKSPDYFFTLTCNMSGCFGVKPLFEAIKESFQDETPENFEAIVQSFMSLFVRMWERVSAIVMQYIEQSNEKPLGDVNRIWWRYEFQSTQGNLPHIHCLLWVNENKLDESFQNRVVAMKSQLFNSLQSPLFRQIGLVESYDDGFDKFKEAVRIHYHSCSAVNFRCHKKTDEKGDTHCRYPIYPPSMEYFHSEIEVSHSDDTFSILEKCGLAKSKEGFVDTYTVTEDLKAGQWFYPSRKNENMTPMNPHLFLLTESQNNLLICDKYLSARYIAKYAAGMEEKARITLTAGRASNQLKVKVGEIENNKIAAVQHRLNKQLTQEKKEACHVKHLCITECYWHLYNFPFVKSSFTSVCVHTCEMESRPGIKINRKNRSLGDLSVSIRNKLPSWRQFTDNQKQLISLNNQSNISVSSITAFSARPPELLFIDNPRAYFWLFERLTIEKNSFKKMKEMLSVNNMHWIDGFSRQIVIRRNRVTNFLDILNNCSNNSALQLKSVLTSQTMLNGVISPNSDSRSNSVIYFSKIYPSDPPKFLIHLLLSMGQFQTEFDLFNCHCLKESFVSSGLYDITQSIDNNVITLTKRYILEQAQFLPGSTRMFDRNVTQCYQVLNQYFGTNQLAQMQPPRVLTAAVKENNNDKAENFLNALRMSISKGLVACRKIPNCPDERRLVEATTNNPLPFTPTITRTSGQTDTSYQRQKFVLEKFITAIDLYTSGSACSIPHQFVLGRPGTGKSTVSLIALCYAMCRGLFCMVTTLAGEKAMQHGGLHLHRLVPIPVSSSLPVIKQVETIVQKLYTDPLRLVVLKKMDVIIVEELGMLNSEQWSVLDQTLRFVNNSNIPFGGILVLGNGDPKQLRPPSGPLIWISPILLTNFNLYYLKEYVRMTDPNGARVLSLLDERTITEDVALDIVKIISENCHFVPSWDQIPRDSATLRVVPTKQAERKLINEHEDLIKRSGLPNVTLKCSDEISRRGHNIWTKSTDELITTYLNRQCLEPESLFLYEGAPMRITRNDTRLNLCQGQLCVIQKVPQIVDLNVCLFVAPPCVRELPPVGVSGTRDYLSHGWRSLQVKKVDGMSHKYSHSFSVRRIHFPLKPFEASTIHKCIGDDVPLLATQITTADPNEKKMFKLWERNQLLVLLSRVQKLENLTFVGNKDLTLKTIEKICYNVNQWDFFIDSFVEQLANANDESNNVLSIPQSEHVFPISRHYIADDNCCSVYVCLSLRDGSLEIDCCTNVKLILQQMNSFTSNLNASILARKPWALLCAAFFPSADGIDASLLALQTQWLRVAEENNAITPQLLCRQFEYELNLNTRFYESVHFVSFIES